MFFFHNFRASQLMNHILIFEITLVFLFTISTLIAGSYGGSLASSFAQGHSMAMQKIIQESKGISIHTIELCIKILSFNTLTNLIVMLLEVICYIKIYYVVYQSNLSVKSMISAKHFGNRRRRNVTTLRCQVLCFVLETTSGVLIIVMLSFHDHPYIDESLFPVLFLIYSCLMTLVQIMISPELNKYVVKGCIFR